MLRRIAYLLGSAAAVAGLALAGAGAASAAPAAPLSVTLSASGTGASAVWSGGSIILTPGSPASSTYAQMAVNRPGEAPATPPSFTTSNYAAGSPRWVIELANGNFVAGYPAQLGTAANSSFTGSQWAVGNSGTYGSYQAALAGADDPLGNVKVTNAYIVADGDQAAGTADVLTSVQYNGQVPVRPVTPSGTYDLTDAAGRCLHSDQVHGRQIGSTTTSQDLCTTVSLVAVGHGYYRLQLGGISLCADVALNGGAVYSNSCLPSVNGDWKVSTQSLHGKYEVVPLKSNGSRLEVGARNYLRSLAVTVSKSSTWTLTPVS